MPYIDFAELKKAVSIAQAVEMLGLEVKKSGEQLRGACPTCGTDDPRALAITPAKQVFYCHKGQEGGDLIRLVAHVRGLAQKDAAQAIAEYVGFKASNRTKPEEKKQSTVKPDARLAEIGKRLDAHAEELEPLGIQPETYERFGAGYNKRGTLSGKLLIPVHDKGGELLAYCGRDVEKGTLHFHSFDPTTAIFNAHRVEEGHVFVCRDPLAVLRAHEHSETNVVAFMADVSAEMLDALAALMREKKCPTVSLF